MRHTKALERLHQGTVIPAIPLALTADRTFDEAAQRRLVQYYLHCGVGGVATAVHSTQFEIRDPKVNLFPSVLKVCIEEIQRFEEKTGKTIVRIAGACGEASQAVEEAKLAKKLGYDAVLLAPGGLAHLSEEQLLERTRKVGEVLPVIGFYLQPAVGGRYLSSDYWHKLADIPSVVAIKAAPFDRYFTEDLVRGVAHSKRREQVALYTGNDDNIVLDLLAQYRYQVDGKSVTMRFAGGLLGHWSVWTSKVVELFERLVPYKDGRNIPVELLEEAAQITDANGVIFDVAGNFRGCIPGIHQVLYQQGLLPSIACLNPKEVLSNGQYEEIQRIYKMYPHLTDDEFVSEFLQQYAAEMGEH